MSLSSGVPLTAVAACGSALGCATLTAYWCASSSPSEPEDLKAFKAKRDRGCRDPEGWLTLIGLHWLSADKKTTVGSGSDCDVVLDAAVPPLVGTLSVSDDVVSFTPVCAVELDDGDRRALSAGTSVELAHAPKPSIVRVGTVLFMLIKRDGAFALRVKDSTCPVLANFSGMTHFPYQPAWCVTATFVVDTQPSKVMVPNILSDVGTEATSHGKLSFTSPTGTYGLVTM